MKLVSLIKKALILCVFFIFLSLLPIPMLNIPSVAIVEASEENSKDDLDNVKLIIKTISLVKENSSTLRVYNTTDSMKVSFKSNDTSVVSILEGDRNTATVTGLSVGVTTVTVTIKDGRKTATLSCDIVVGPPITSYKFSVDKINLGVGKRRTLSAIVKPNNTTEVPVFISTNESVATVNDNGRVTAISAGTTYIKAKLSNGDIAICTIVVDASINDGDED